MKHGTPDSWVMLQNLIQARKGTIPIRKIFNALLQFHELRLPTARCGINTVETKCLNLKTIGWVVRGWLTKVSPRTIFKQQHPMGHSASVATSHTNQRPARVGKNFRGEHLQNPKINPKFNSYIAEGNLQQCSKSMQKLPFFCMVCSCPFAPYSSELPFLRFYGSNTTSPAAKAKRGASLRCKSESPLWPCNAILNHWKINEGRLYKDMIASFWNMTSSK